MSSPSGVTDNRSIPEQVRRLVLGSVRSIPHLEALLLLRNNPKQAWEVRTIARRLYVDPKLAGEVISDLAAAGFCVQEGDPLKLYRYNPSSPELALLVEQIAEVYATNLIGLTELIHARGRMKEQQFADAFLLRKD